MSDNVIYILFKLKLSE